MSYLDNHLDLSKGTSQKFSFNVLSYDYGPSLLFGRYIKTSSLFPVPYKSKSSMMKLKLSLEFENKGKGFISNIIDFTEFLKDGVNIKLNDGYEYFCFIEGMSEPDYKGNLFAEVSIEFSAIRHKQITSFMLTSTAAQQNIIGQVKPDCIVKIEPLVGTISTLTVLGITVTNITNTVVVDGFRKTVKQGNDNKFGDTDLVEFPKLTLGISEYTGNENAKITISYYPIYL